MRTAVAIFAYRRPDHLKMTLKSLFLNNELKHTDLIFFCDGPKNKKEFQKTNEVISICKSITFKNKKMYIQSKNIGLANSIKNGVDIVFNKLNYKQIIVIEDDLILGKNFISFCLKSLKYYKSEKNIGSITGYNFLGLVDTKDKPCLTYRHSSWGWATWNNVWNKIEWNIKHETFVTNEKLKNKIDKAGEDLIYFLKDQNERKIDSWSVIFNINCLLNNLYCLCPSQSIVRNIGMDQSGTHLGKYKKNNFDFNENFQCNKFQKINIKNKINIKINNKIRKKYSPTILRKIFKFLKKQANFLWH